MGLMLQAMALALLANQVAEPISDTIEQIERQIESEEAILSPARREPPWPRTSEARLISDQFPTTFGDLVEVPSPTKEQYLTLVGDDLALRASGSDAVTLLTQDGTPKRTWRATEEASQSFPATWSRDGRHIAAVRLDLRDVFHEPLLRPLVTPPEIDHVPYPRAGEPMQRFEPFIIDAGSGQRVAMNLGDTTDQYVTLHGWRGDDRAVIVQLIDRAHKRLRIMDVDRATGLARERFSETSESYIDTPMTLSPQLIHPLGSSNDILYLSEKTGWRHVYRVGMDGRAQALTSGEFPVVQIVAIDEARGWVYFLASRDAAYPYAFQLYRVPLSGGRTEHVFGSRGHLTVVPSPALDAFFIEESSVDTPPRSFLIAADGAVIEAYPQADLSALEISIEPFVAPSADNAWDMHGIIFKPAGFDPDKTYPVVEVVYGGMQTDFVPRRFYGFGRTQAGYNGLLPRILANRGYVVVMVSAPGTPGRGRAFRDVTYSRWPQGVIADHVSWIRKAAASRPWMDLSRVGILGNSWGGYMTQRALIDAPDFYRAGVSMAAPSDFVDHPPYIEPFMNLPDRNPEGYAAGSNLDKVAAIKGSVMVIAWPLDVNAGFSPSWKLIDALVKERRDLEVFTYPDINHRINCCGRDAEFYTYAVIARFLDRHLAVGREAGPEAGSR